MQVSQHNHLVPNIPWEGVLAVVYFVFESFNNKPDKMNVLEWHSGFWRDF